MPPQRSFFEKDGLQRWKQKSRWPHGTYHDFTRAVTHTVSGHPVKSPIEVSSKTRSKLKAFEFSVHKNRMNVAERTGSEMASSHVGENLARGQENESASATTNATFPQKPVTTESRDLPNMKTPQTPTPRIPLAELIGSNEESVSRPAREPTPEDKVCWRHQRSPTSTYVPGVLLRRGTKRARSSSPLPSPCQPYLEDAADGDLLNLQILQKSLDTPQADPAANIWNGYLGKGSANAKGGDHPLQLLPFSPLMLASPRTGAGLRRTMSGGIEWPMSKVKRRKISNEDDNPQKREQRQLAEQERAARKARVNNLLERVKRGLEGTAEMTGDAAPSDPSSSSPLAGELGAETGMPPSPLQAKTAMRNMEPIPEECPAYEGTLAKDASDHSSDFGGLDLDQADLSILDSIESAQQAISEAHSKVASVLGSRARTQSEDIRDGNDGRSLYVDGAQAADACPAQFPTQTVGPAETEAAAEEVHTAYEQPDGDEGDKSDEYSDDFPEDDQVIAEIEERLQCTNSILTPGNSGVAAPGGLAAHPLLPFPQTANQRSQLEDKDEFGDEDEEFGDVSDEALEAAAAEVMMAHNGNPQLEDDVSQFAEWKTMPDQGPSHAGAAISAVDWAQLQYDLGGIDDFDCGSSEFAIENGKRDDRVGIDTKSSPRSPTKRQRHPAPPQSLGGSKGLISVFTADGHDGTDCTTRKGVQQPDDDVDAKSTSNEPDKKRIQRYLITRIEEGQYQVGTADGRKRTCREKILFVLDQDRHRTSFRERARTTVKSSPGDWRSSCRSNGDHSSGKSSQHSSTDSVGNSTINSSRQDDRKLTIILRQSWYDTRCTSGDYVHLTGSFEEVDDGNSPGMLVAIVDDLNNMIVLHPDHLLSATVVADSFGCIRRAVLQDRVKATNEPSEAQVYGHILHEIFQAGLRANRWDRQYLGQAAEDIVRRHHLEDLYLINVDLPRAIAHLTDRVAEFEAWAKVFVSAEPKPEAIVAERNGKQATLAINKLLDVEEHVWSPMYGLKGNIDATIQTVVEGDEEENGEATTAHARPRRKTLLVPLELKTGRNTSDVAHRAQTSLYTLLLSDRYDVDVVCGLLYYMETSTMTRIRSMRNELRHLIIQRNELACFVRDRSQQLPPMLKRSHACGRCYAKVPCFVYHKLVDGGDSSTAGFGPGEEHRFDDIVRHLTPTHEAFFKHWDGLLAKEESNMLTNRRELWTMLSTERERLGRCFANVVIEPGSFFEDLDAPKVYRYRYNLVRGGDVGHTAPTSFLESQLVVGEPIVISDEAGHFALANGFVAQVTRRKVVVSVDRKLQQHARRQEGFDEKRNQIFRGIMEVSKEDSDGVESAGDHGSDDMSEPVLYRLDKDEFNNGMATVRNNLVQIMTNAKIGCREIRELVVDGRPPTFNSDDDAIMTGTDTSSCPTTSSDLTYDGGAEQQHGQPTETLNLDQKRAIKQVMAANNYALVLGMPGTGKTTTIAHIIRALVGSGKSVLLTSYTHTAVDNILLKLRPRKRVQKNDGPENGDNDEPDLGQERAIPVLRLGAVAKIHPEVQRFATLGATLSKKVSSTSTSIEELHKAYHDPPIVATTCLGISHALFNTRVFDYCIVDEASQITVPVCLGPMRMARKFVLVGDHNQLPPLVQNEEARTGGLDVSLFKILSDRHPRAVVRLAHQYRMCREIMDISNTLIYGGVLTCGSDEVARRMMDVPNWEERMRILHMWTHESGSRSNNRRGLRGHRSTSTSPKKLSVLAPLKHSQIAPACDCPFCSEDLPRQGQPGVSSSSCWLRQLVDPAARVCFVNTDTLLPASREEARGSRIVNPVEAKLCAQIVETLRYIGVPGSDVGVMTVYRSQLALLRHEIHRQQQRRRALSQQRHNASHPCHHHHHNHAAQEPHGNATAPDNEPSCDEDFSQVEMHTTDKFQGRDKEIIILSLVRSNEGKNIGDLLRDWRRINVAFTRARTKLIVLGSKETLAEDELLRAFIELADERRWTMDVPRAALDMHRGFFGDAEDGGTQLQTQGQTQGQNYPLVERAPQPSSSSSSPQRARIGKTPRSPRSPMNPRGGGGSGSIVVSGLDRAGKENTSPSPSSSSPSKTPSKTPSRTTETPSKTTKKPTTRVADKTGRLSQRTLLLGSRPVLRDIINDIT